MTMANLGERRAVTIRVFLPDGNPEGLRKITKSHWAGCVLMCSRSELPKYRGRDEFQRVGAYILVGPSDDGNRFGRAYIGEGEVGYRLDHHLTEKDFWTHFVLFTSTEQHLNKAHVEYIESRLVAIALRTKRARVENGNVPQLPMLSEEDAAHAEAFLHDLLQILPILGISAFDELPSWTPTPPDGEGLLRLAMETGGVQAEGREVPGGFWVYAGATGSSDERQSQQVSTKLKRAALLEDGILERKGDRLVLAQHHIFSSPSQAAGVLAGYPLNGRHYWRDPKGRNLNEIEREALKAEAGSTAEDDGAADAGGGG